MGVKLNICLLLLLVAIISSQAFNLRKKEDSKDEKPFGNYRRGSPCSNYGGRCMPHDFPCPPGSHECRQLPGCYPGVERCCCQY
ncbi:PREDICTED: small cysteine-rich protein 3 [Acropora digitifera]|uniref:small cysteine-rich protein 3 n=1 Tax=Acropora digitifera TaxID=70779 RepID=UPI00077AD991|nr:PREDICTED: small cysteine-rich protein 3 [Acropora digitifera]